MRVVIIFLFVIVFIASCRNETEPTAEDADTIQISTETSKEIDSVPYNVEYSEQTHDLSLVRSKESIKDADVADVIAAFNKKYEGIKLDLVKLGKDTISVKIADASKLTQGMGSTGAEAYLAELTFSLTELQGIKAVKIDFEEGDHAMPGVYTREDFKGLIHPGSKK